MSDKTKGIIAATAAGAAVATAALTVPPVIMQRVACARGREFKLSDAFKGKDRKSKRSMLEVKRKVREIKQREYESVEIESYDGLKLKGKYFANPQKAKRLIICFHGYRSSDYHDFSYSFDYWFERGFDILLVTQRAHGESEGKYITFGIKERFDCKSWVEYAVKRFKKNVEILLEGVSMGATTVLMASSLKLPKNVKAIVADCGFISPFEILKHVMKKTYKLPAFPYLYLTSAASGLLAGFGFKDASTVDAVKRTDIPIFFAHGSSDGFVPCRMSIDAFDACASDKKLFIAGGADHALSYVVQKSDYERTLGEFLSKYIKNFKI